MSIDLIHYGLTNNQHIWGEEFPGFLVMESPRNAARHRKGDILAALLHIDGKLKPQKADYQEILTDIARVFFETQGSLTRAIQTSFDHANQLFHNQNIDRSGEGIISEGSLNLTVLHKGWIFMGHYGRVASFHIAPELFETLGKATVKNEALGQTKRIQPRFSQCEINPEDLIILCSEPPQFWTVENLSGSVSMSMPSLRDRLLSQVDDPFEALVIRCAAGSGRAIAGEWFEGQDEEKNLSPDPFPIPDELVEEENLVTVFDEDQESLKDDTENHANELTHDNVESNSFSASDALLEQIEEIPISLGQTEGADFSQKSFYPKNSVNPMLLLIAQSWIKSKTLIARFRLFFSRTKGRFTKKETRIQTEKSPIIPLFLVLILPLALILSSLSKYSRTGKNEQFMTYFSQAQEIFELAEKEKNGTKKHGYWEQTLQLVAQAEQFNVTRESRLLYEQAQFLMDEMDLAARLDFRPALTSFFPDGIVISRIKSSYSGIFLLDETSGSILRVYLNPKGFYEIDDTFKCQPGTYGLETVTKLIDFITLPANDENYRIMAIDEKGNLLYCRTNDRTDSRTLAAPEGGWGKITALGYDQDVIYVLDSEKSAIWMYAGRNPSKPDVATAAGIVFADTPKKFFDEDIPDLKGAIDVAVNQQEMLILHQDGHMTLCRYSAQKEIRLTECQDPAPYTDNRIGRDNKKPWIFLDSEFTMMQDTKLPNLSVFILETSEPAVYQFSFQLNLERTLRIMPNKNFPIPKNAPSGFGVTPEMEIILAFDNRLYIAPLR